jgi:hypothetical protein
MSFILMENPLDVPTHYDLCYTPQNQLIFENMRGMNHMDFDVSATSVFIRAGSVLEMNGVLLKAANDEEVSIAAGSLALTLNLENGNVMPVMSLAGYKYDRLRRGVYNGNSRLFHTLVKRAANTTGFTASTITSADTTKFWVAKGLHIFYMRGGKGGDGGLGGTDQNNPGALGATGAVYQFIHFETKGQWAIAICGYDGMPPLSVENNVWIMAQPNNDAGGGGGCSGNASIIMLQDGTVYTALGGSGGGGGRGGLGNDPIGSKGGSIIDATLTGAGGGGAVGSNDNGAGNAGEINKGSYSTALAGGGGNGGKGSLPLDGTINYACDGGLGPGAGGGAAPHTNPSVGGWGGTGSHGPGGIPAGANRIENYLSLNGSNGFPSPSADQSWWDLSPNDLAAQYYPIYAGGGAGGGDYNASVSGTCGGTMIWAASDWLTRSGSQTIIDYQVS